MSSYAQIMSSYTHFGMPTCKQAAMQTYRVCKIAEDWRQQQSSALVKRQQQSSTTPLLSPVSHITFMLQCSGIKLQTQYIYHGLPTSGRAKITAYYSYSCLREKHLYIRRRTLPECTLGSPK